MNTPHFNFSHIQMNVQDAFIMMDPSGNICYWNQGAQDIFGWTEKEVVGRSLHDLVAPERYHDAFQKGFLHFAKTGTGPVVSAKKLLHAIHKDGHEFTIELSLGAIKIEGQWYAIGLVRDKALQKQLEFQLLHAERLESISTLAAGFAHDFNNILASIIGYAELALDDAEQGTLLYTNMTEVLTAGNRAKDLVHQILKFSKQLNYDNQPMYLKSMILESMKLVRASFPETINIRIDLQSDRYIFADPARVHQLLLNLCTNAGNAMGNKGVLSVTLVDLDSIDLTHAPKKAQGAKSYVRLSVEDTGIGMATDILSKAFTPFFTTREQGEGRGMGLPLVHGIVSDLNGWIDPSSEPGKGSRFDIYIPAMDKSVSEAHGSAAPVRGESGRILFVDDEDPIVKMSKQLLERMGYKVEAHSSSPEALKSFTESPDKFNLVITDLAMPYMNGLALSRKLRQIRPDIPIIMCTGYGLSVTDTEAREAGIKAIVYKPILSDQIAETIGRVLGSQPFYFKEDHPFHG